MQSRYDLAIIGSGGAAFAAAIRATTLGKSVVMIERGTFGGTCVNTGCVPSKALIAAADARHSAADAADRFPGIATTAGPVDMPALIAGKQALLLVEPQGLGGGAGRLGEFADPHLGLRCVTGRT